MPRKDLPKGCLFRRGRRWYYKLGGRIRACKPEGASHATTRRAVAVQIARRFFDEAEGDRTSLGDLIAEFGALDGMACSHQQAGYKPTVVREFVRMMGVGFVSEIVPRQINLYLAKLAEKGQAPKTLVNKRACIGRFCEWLMEQGEIDHNPVRLTRRPKVRRGEPVHLTRNELDTALKIATERRLWAVHFAAYTGARLGAIRRLRWGDIRETASGPVVVYRETKTDRCRAVPVTDKLAAVIARMDRGADDELIFPRHTRRWWTCQLRPIKEAVPKMARRGGGWHDFRRTVGSLLVQAGSPILAVSKILGHANVYTTAAYYAHLDAEAGREHLAIL